MKYEITSENVKLLDEVCQKRETITYKELCQLLQFYPLPNPSSIVTKKSILKQLANFCEIEEIHPSSKLTKYIIKQIYPEPLVAAIHKNNKFQEYIEQAVLTKALEEPSKKLYLSNIEILYLTSMVNKNFKIICNADLAKQIEGKEWLHSEAFIIYSILHRWLKDRLLQMHARHIIELQRGYRVYKTFVNAQGQEITIKQNVEKGSELDKKCQQIFYRAIEATPNVPNDWKGEWLPLTTYNELKKHIRIIAKEMLADEGWDNVRTVNLIIPVRDKELLLNQIKNVEKILNDESKRKIKETKQLNHLTGFEREIAVSELIDINTQIDYLQFLEE